MIGFYNVGAFTGDEFNGDMPIWLVPLNSTIVILNNIPSQNISYSNERFDNNNINSMITIQ